LQNKLIHSKLSEKIAAIPLHQSAWIICKKQNNNLKNAKPSISASFGNTNRRFVVGAILFGAELS